MTDPCPECKGKCCRDTDYGNRVYHMAAEFYEHWCEDCSDGDVPQPDPRDAMLASLRQELHHMNRAIANYLTERDRLRQAIRHWAVGPHAQWCTTRAECPCDCGAAQEFDWRETARKLVGLEDGEL